MGTSDTLELQGPPDEEHTDFLMGERTLADLFFLIFSGNIQPV